MGITRTLLLFSSCAVISLNSYAQTYPPDIFQHLLWEAQGNRFDQSYSAKGISYLGRLNDSLPRVVGISDGASMSACIADVGKSDTTRRFELPGIFITRFNSNGDDYPDLICRPSSGNIVVLLGTAKADSFVTAITLSGQIQNFENADPIPAIDCDSDGYDDFLLAERNYNDVGIIKFYRGGPKIDTLTQPSETLVGRSLQSFVGGQLQAGRIRNSTGRFLVEARYFLADPNGYPDTVYIVTYKLGKGFHLIPYDTIICNITVGGTYRYTFLIADADGDGIDDILIGTSSAVLIYKGGDTIRPDPTYILHRPFPTGSETFASKLVDAGNVTGHGYHTLLVGDWDGSVNGGNNGAVFLYNLGSALKDSCVAYGYGQSGDNDAFGQSMAAMGDINGDGFADFIIGSNYLTSINTTGYAGEVYVFLGDPSYGLPVGGIVEHVMPEEFQLGRNYPNPFGGISNIETIVPWSSGNQTTSLKVYDVLGRLVLNEFEGPARSLPRWIPVDARKLNAGSYRYELRCGMMHSSRWMQVVR